MARKGEPKRAAGKERPMTLAEAGKLGGEKRKEELGHEGYVELGKRRAETAEPGELSEIGRKGGETVVEKYGPEHMAEIGRKGGEARVEQSRRIEKEE